MKSKLHELNYDLKLHVVDFDLKCWWLQWCRGKPYWLEFLQQLLFYTWFLWNSKTLYYSVSTYDRIILVPHISLYTSYICFYTRLLCVLKSELLAAIEVGRFQKRLSLTNIDIAIELQLYLLSALNTDTRVSHYIRYYNAC